MKPIDLHIMGYWISPPGTLSGNTRILIEFIKRWCKNPDIHITVYTFAEGAKTLEIYSVPEAVSCRVASNARFAWSYNPINHAWQIQAAIRNISSITDTSDSQILIYSASEFWPDVMPAVLLRKRFPKAKWLGGFYLFGPNPFLGYEGTYGPRKFMMPGFRLTVNYYFYKKIVLAFLVRYADMLFITNQCDADFFLQRSFSNEKIRAIYGGVDLAEAQSVEMSEPAEFVGCFVGRIHPQKGIEDLLRIWHQVCQYRPGSRLALIGSGIDPKYEAQMRKLCTDLGLDDTVQWFGYVDGVKKYEILKRSRVFLHTTIYDNSGMAAAEAMAAGLPVVAYDLPPLRVPYPKGMLKVPPRDIYVFAETITNLLTNPDLYQKTKKDAMEIAQDWDWGKRANDAWQWIQQNLVAK